MNISLSRPLPKGMGVTTQLFGENPARYAIFGMAGHEGTDYGVAHGTPVLASNAGIGKAGWDPTGYGIYVTVTGPTFKTIYAHMSLTYVYDGVPILEGMQVGLVGSTGNSTGSHLHHGIKVHDMRNPAYRDWIDGVPFRDI